MSKIEMNAKYAPGISTYGASGAQGKQGYNGYSLYYVPYNIDSLPGNGEDNTSIEISLIKKDILNNVFISTNISGDRTLLDRQYQVGDMFILPNSKIYKILLLDKVYGNITWEYLGTLNRPVPFAANNDYVYNSNGQFLLLGDFVPDNLPNEIPSLLTIYDKDGKFITLGKNENTLSFVKSGDFFNIISDKPVVFNTGLYANNNSTAEYITDDYGDIYYKVVSYNIPDIIEVNTLDTFTGTINIKSLINTIPDNATFSLNISYNKNDELLEYYIMNINPNNTITLKNDDIKSINLIINYNDNYISKTYKIYTAN